MQSIQNTVSNVNVNTTFLTPSETCVIMAAIQCRDVGMAVHSGCHYVFMPTFFVCFGSVISTHSCIFEILLLTATSYHHDKELCLILARSTVLWSRIALNLKPHKHASTPHTVRSKKDLIKEQ